LVKLSKDGLHELYSPVWMTQELAVVSRGTCEKIHLLFSKVRAQTGYSHQIITIVAEK